MQKRTDAMARVIDVSHYQGNINWPKVRAAGIVGAIMKASQGSGSDDTFARNIAGARAAGVIVGAYHFLNASSTKAAVDEARHFIDVMNSVGGAASLDLPPALDYENNPAGIGRASINAVAKAFLDTVQALTGIKPMLYTGNAFAQNFDAWASAYELWIARYTDNLAVVPWDAGPWTAWTLWQYSESGYVDGIPDNQVDLNVFSGTEADFRAKYTKTQEEDDEMNKVLEYGEWAWNELDMWAGDAYNDDYLEKWDWVQKIRDKKLTYGELLLLKVLIDERRRTNNKVVREAK